MNATITLSPRFNTGRLAVHDPSPSINFITPKLEPTVGNACSINTLFVPPVASANADELYRNTNFVFESDNSIHTVLKSTDGLPGHGDTIITSFLITPDSTYP